MLVQDALGPSVSLAKGMNHVQIPETLGDSGNQCVTLQPFVPTRTRHGLEQF